MKAEQKICIHISVFVSFLLRFHPFTLRDVSLFSGGWGGGSVGPPFWGEGHNVYPSCLGEGHNFFQGFLGEGHNFFQVFFIEKKIGTPCWIYNKSSF